MRHWTAIKSFKYSRKHSVVYNAVIREKNVTESLESGDIDALHDEQDHAFKSNVSIGSVLINQSGEDDSLTLRHFHASANSDRVFAKP